MRRPHRALRLSMVLLATIPLAGCVVGRVPEPQQPYVQDGTDYTPYGRYDPTSDLDVFRLTVEGNVGDAELDFQDPGADALNAEQDAARMRVTAEGYVDSDRQIGPGLTIEGWHSEATEFAGGSGASGVDGRLERFSITPHVSLQAQPNDIFQVVGRAGPTFMRHRFKDNAGAEGLDFYSFGVRLEAEPELFVIRGYGADVSLFGRATTSLLSAVGIDSDAFPDEDFFTNGVELQATVGGKLRIQNLMLMAGYTWERTFFDESDEENGLAVVESDFAFEGLMFGGGIVF
jgi:hypothetical protein